MKWNQQKLEKMLEHSRALNLALRDLNERRNDARTRLAQVRAEVEIYPTRPIPNALGRADYLPAPPDLLRDRDVAEVEYLRLDAAHAEAQDHWQQYGAVVANLQQFAEQNLGYRRSA